MSPRSRWIQVKFNACFMHSCNCFVLGATAGCFQSQALTWYCGRECYGVSHFQCKILYCDSDPKMVSMMCDCGSYTSEAVSLSQLFRNFQQQCILQQSSFAQSQVQQHQYGSSNGAGFFVQPGVQSQYSAPNEVGNAVAPPLVMRPKPYIEPAYAASPSRMCSPYC